MADVNAPGAPCAARTVGKDFCLVKGTEGASPGGRATNPGWPEALAWLTSCGAKAEGVTDAGAGGWVAPAFHGRTPCWRRRRPPRIATWSAWSSRTQPTGSTPPG